MTPILRLLIASTAALCLLGACGQGARGDNEHNNSDAASHDDDHTDAEGEGEEHDEEQVVALTQAELDEFDIEIATAGSYPIEISVTLPGEVVMNPDGVAHVVARATGIVLDVYKTIGDTVSAGDPLAVLESPALAQAKAEYLSRDRENELAKTDLARAETVYKNTSKLLKFLGDSPSLDALRDFSDLDLGENRRILVSAYAELVASEAIYTREQTLFEKQIGSEAEFLEAESGFKQAQAAFLSVRDDLAFTNARTLDQRRRESKVAEVALLAAERNLHGLGMSDDVIAAVDQESDEELSRYVIAAPLDGVITERHIVRGEQMNQGDDVYTIADFETVWIQLIVYQKDLPTLRAGQTADVSAQHGIAQDSGTIQYISPVIDESTRTTTARIVLENLDGAWRPGLFVTGRVITASIEPRVAVPITAVQTIKNDQVVFVRAELGFEPRVVRLGRGNNAHVEIVEGLDPGDEYVATGGFVLKAELNKASFEGGGHGH